MVSETLAEVMRDQSADLTERALVKAQAAGVEPTKAVIADFIREDLQTTINVSHLGGSVAALLMGLDPTVAGYTAANALYNNFALSTVRKAIEEYGEALAAGAHESYESVKSALEGATSEALERIADILENHPERVAMCAEIMILSIVAAREERLGRPASHAAGIGKGPTGQKIEAQKKEGITATLKAAPKFFKDLARSIRSGRSGGGAGAGGASSVAVSAAGAVRPAEPARQPQKQVRFADGVAEARGRSVQSGPAATEIKTRQNWIRDPSSIQDQMVLEAAKRGEGRRIMGELGDVRFKDMEKFQLKVKSQAGRDTVVHYVRNPKTGELLDFKFKKRSID